MNNEIIQREKEVANIVNQFDPFRMAPLPDDQYDLVGRNVLHEKVRYWVNRGEPVKFAMLGYPFKSTNKRDKVIGDLPDLGEELSFRNFKNFFAAVKKVYPAGAELTMASDGFVFNDLLELEDKNVIQYGEVNREWTKAMPIKWVDLRNFYEGATLPYMRDKLMHQFGISEEELMERIMLNPDVNFLYRGIKIFMGEEFATRSFVSKNQQKKFSGDMAKKVMMRNEAYNGLVRHEFDKHIRLSMHPSVNNGYKYSFQLIPSAKAMHSPWHSAVAIEEDGTIRTVHKSEVLDSEYELQYKDGRAYNYISTLGKTRLWGQGITF